MGRSIVGLLIVLIVATVSGCAGPTSSQRPVSAPATGHTVVVPVLTLRDLAATDSAPSAPGGPPGATVVSGQDLRSWRWASIEETPGTALELQFDDVGTRALAQWTTDHVGDRLALYLGSQLLDAPRVMEPITGGNVELTSDGVLKFRSLIDSAMPRQR